MNKEYYVKPESKLVLFDLEEVYMLDLESKSDGNNNFFGDDEDGEWDE